MEDYTVDEVIDLTETNEETHDAEPCEDSRPRGIIGLIIGAILAIVGLVFGGRKLVKKIKTKRAAASDNANPAKSDSHTNGNHINGDSGTPKKK